MSGINTPKLVTGGLVAGVVLNILDFIWNTTVLATDFRANLTRLGLDPAAMETTMGIAVWVIIDFVLGFLLVWTYAAIRPRFGPGPRTAVYAGLVIFMSITAVMFGLSQGGLMDQPLFFKSSALSLITTIAGTVAGAWAYKEV